MKILLVEDDRDTREVMGALLKKRGYSVVTAENGHEALKRAESDPPDLIISDIMMPEMDGYMMCRKLKTDERLKKIPVILYTATMSEKDEEKLALDMGAARFIAKPAAMPVILEAVREELEKLKEPFPPPAGSPADGLDQDYLRVLSRKLQVKERELSEARRNLEENDKRYRDLIASMPEPMFIHKDGTFLYLNPACLRLMGAKAPEELVGSALLDMVAPESRESTIKLLKSIASGGNQNSLMELKVRRLDGTLLDVAFAGFPVVYKGESARHVTFTDISERKLAEAGIKKERDQAQQYLDVAGVMIAALDLDGNIALINKKGCEMLGYREDELLGGNWFELCLPKDIKEEVRGVFRKLISGDMVPVEQYDNPVLTKTGERRIIAFRNSVVRDASGRISGILFSGGDVTERHLAEEEVRRKEVYLDNAIDGISALDMAGNFIYVNETVVRATGYSREELIGKNVGMLNPPLEAVRVPANIKKIAEAGSALFTVTHVRKDGTTYPVEVYSRLLDLGGRKIILAIDRDITERKRAEETLRRSEELLRQSQKLDSIGQLSGGIAHDLNNLLGPVLGYADMLKKGLPPEDPLLDDVAEIAKAAERAAALVRHLLAFSRRQVLEPRIINVNDSVKNIDTMLRRVIGERVNLALALDPGIGPVKADPGQIE